MIAPGAIVRVRRRGDVAFVVHSSGIDGRWRVVSKTVYDERRSAFSSLTVGAGDTIVVEDAPTYEVGAAVEHEGWKHTASGDLGDQVELIVPASRRPLKGGGALYLPGANTITVGKSDLVLEQLK